MRQNLRSSELRFPRRVAASFNLLPEANRRVVSPLDARQWIGHKVAAPAFVCNGGRSANRSGK
jgi:hypothetical protein